MGCGVVEPSTLTVACGFVSNELQLRCVYVVICLRRSVLLRLRLFHTLQHMPGMLCQLLH
jgi:hypothetical protein